LNKGEGQQRKREEKSYQGLRGQKLSKGERKHREKGKGKEKKGKGGIMEGGD
jgi:hypothetical protein